MYRPYALSNRGHDFRLRYRFARNNRLLPPRLYRPIRPYADIRGLIYLGTRVLRPLRILASTACLLTAPLLYKGSFESLYELVYRDLVGFNLAIIGLGVPFLLY
jgi:hypothetical protein